LIRACFQKSIFFPGILPRPSFDQGRTGRWLFLAGALLFWTSLILGGAPAWAQSRLPGAQPANQGETPGKYREEAEKAWLAHREYLEKGDWPKSQAELEKVYQWKLDQGIRNDYASSLALLRESAQVGRKGMAMASPEILSYADRMAPDFSQVAQARAYWLLTEIPSNWENATRAVLTWGRGVFLSFANPEEALPRLANISFWVLGAFLLTFAAFAFSLFFRHYFFFTHHLKHLIRLQMSPIPLMVLSLLVLFSPFFLGLGWMWLFVLWTLVFWVYGGRSDRWVTVILLGLLLLLPSGIRFHSALVLSLTGNGVPEVLQANNGAWTEELRQKLLALNRVNPRDTEILLSLALVEKRMGRWNEAEQRTLQVLQLNPQSAAALNNQGNILLLSNRPDQAMDAYHRATLLEPSRGEAYYNLGQAYLLKLRMKEADAEFQRAQTLHPQKISDHTSISSKNPNRLVIDRTVEPLQIWKRVFSPSPERDRIARNIWEILWQGVPLERGEIAMAVLFGLLGLVHLGSQRLSLIRNCERCGSLICSRCTRSRVIGNQCVQCLNAFTVNATSDPKVVRKKRAEVARYQSRLNFLPQRLSWFLPGVGHLMRGRSLEGILYLFLLILFLTRGIWWSGWIPDPLALGSPLGVPWLIITVVLFILFYVWAQYRMSRIRLKGGMSYFRRA
jgi:tetratricopeptide (TPR) repeat protein